MGFVLFMKVASLEKPKRQVERRVVVDFCWRPSILYGTLKNSLELTVHLGEQVQRFYRPVIARHEFQAQEVLAWSLFTDSTWDTSFKSKKSWLGPFLLTVRETRVSSPRRAGLVPFLLTVRETWVSSPRRAGLSVFSDSTRDTGFNKSKQFYLGMKNPQ